MDTEEGHVYVDKGFNFYLSSDTFIDIDDEIDI